ARLRGTRRARKNNVGTAGRGGEVTHFLPIGWSAGGCGTAFRPLTDLALGTPSGYSTPMRASSPPLVGGIVGPSLQPAMDATNSTAAHARVSFMYLGIRQCLKQI